LTVRLQRHLGFSDDAAGARVLAKLRHGDAAQGQRRRVIAQGNSLQSTERVARSKSARGGGDQGIHDDRLPRRSRTYYFAANFGTA